MLETYEWSSEFAKIQIDDVPISSLTGTDRLAEVEANTVQLPLLSIVCPTMTVAKL